MNLRDALHKKVIFIQGKGGVGKSAVASAVATALARQQKRVLLVVLEDPLLPPGKIEAVSTHLDRVNVEPETAFEQYAELKIGSGLIAKLFTHNKLMRYLVKAAPGIKELTTMGKIWHERKHYDHVVVDMPATGHGITLFQAVENWRRLFSGSPLEKEARAMTETFSDPTEVAHVIVALAEEMPLIEALELEKSLKTLHQRVEATLILNRRMPVKGSTARDPEKTLKPFATTLEEHLGCRIGMEERNVNLWNGRTWFDIPYLPDFHVERVTEKIADRLVEVLT